MTLSNFLFSVRGRIGRADFWIGQLGASSIVALAVVIGFVELQFHGVPFFALLISLPACWQKIAISAKRLHDRGRSAWWLALFYLPQIVDVGFVLLADTGTAVDRAVKVIFAFVGIITGVWLVIEMGFLTGEMGDNRFGNDPLETNDVQAAFWSRVVLTTSSTTMLCSVPLVVSAIFASLTLTANGLQSKFSLQQQEIDKGSQSRQVGVNLLRDAGQIGVTNARMRDLLRSNGYSLTVPQSASATNQPSQGSSPQRAK